ncbi:MAG: nucleotidyltransferase substrate binding protein [Gammaproteobacteria bacterium]
MSLQTEHLLNCIMTLESSLEHLDKVSSDSLDHKVFRNAAIKGFELTLETAGKLLRKSLKLFSGNPREIDELVFKDVLRQAGKHGLIDSDGIERWFKYRDNRNSTAHDYSEAFAEETLKLLKEFVQDAKSLQITLKNKLGSKSA